MEKRIYTCFDDYPQDIQKEAKKILNERNPLDHFVNVIGKVHIEDAVAVELVLLSVASLFVENSKPVHQQIKGSLGSGKTSLLQKTLKIVPERYIKRLNNVSPEYLYSIKDSLNPDYNIFLLDDITLTPATTTMLKTLTDNGLENKVFIQSKGAELELPGKNLFFCIFMEENINNKKLEQQLLPNHASETLEYVLEQIGVNEIAGSMETSVSIQQMYLIANALFELMILEPFKVFNLMLFDSNRNSLMYQKPLDIQRFTSLVEARSLYYKTKYENVDNIRLGTENDVDSVNRILQERVTMRDYNLTNQQKKLLISLDVYTEELFNEQKRLYKNDSCDPSTAVCYQFPTYENLAESLGISKNTLKGWIKKGTESLEEKSIVKPMKIDYKKRNSKVFLYLDPKARNIRRSITGFTKTEYDKKRRLKDIFADKGVVEILELFLELENTKTCQEKKSSIINFTKKTHNIKSYDDLATYLHKFKDDSNAC